MKRRGFLGLLFGVPAVPVAAAVMDKLPKGFTRGLVESEPEVTSAEISTCWNYASCVVATPPITYSEFLRRSK